MPQAAVAAVSADSAEALAAAAPDPQRRAVGYRRPPEGRRFRPGVSGNPMGRPRRVVLAPAAARRLVTVEPTELERAVAEPVMCFFADPSAPVSLARAVVARLTERALTLGDVAACRELMRLCAEAEAVAAERAQLLAEQDEAEARAEQARQEAEARAARDAARARRREALDHLDQLVEDAARDAGQQDLDNDERALILLDAVAETGADGRPSALAPWIVDVARAHDPDLPRGVHVHPLDLTDLNGALQRLDIQRFDEEGDPVLAAWFIDAARARRPEAVFVRRDEALLARVRGEEEGEDEVDWEARLERWQEADRGPGAGPAAAPQAAGG